MAISAGRTYVTSLLILDLSFGFRASDNILRLACVFEGLRRCNDKLKAYYNEIEVSLPWVYIPIRPRSFPTHYYLSSRTVNFYPEQVNRYWLPLTYER